ncbi:MAG: PhzF family phenazine biosynthesis isomerase, partial [Robiginitomaculum sp.]|nr:PhzF family phenazine biosynthesis isomerase [Robiginitomaculum sp.]
VDFAGHPVIGTIIALSDLGYASPMVLELGIGPLPCRIHAGTASFTTSVPLQQISEPDTALVAAALGLPLSALRTATPVPVQASLGLPFVLVELDSAASLAACMPNLEAIRKGAKRHPAGLDFAIFAYVRAGSQITSRMFAPLDNIPEDSATGSASATLAALLTALLDAPQSLTFSQGAHMGRPSRIEAVTEMSKSQNPTRVTIAGQAVQTMAGKFIF